MASLGKLTVELEANMAKFQQEMTKSAYITEQAMNKMAAGADLAKTAIKGLAAGLVAGLAANGLSAVTTAINSTIDSFAKLDDMTQKTGASVEGLSKLSKVASTFGQNFDEVDGALTKLAKGMNGVDEEGSKVKAGLKAIGVSTQDLKTQDPGEIFVEVAKKLQGYQDGAAKTALVTDIMGKSAANLLPYMNDVAENIDQFTGVTAEAAATAAAYQDQLGRLKARKTELVQSIISAALPAMLDFSTALVNSKGAAKGLADDSSISTWADKAAIAAAFVYDQFARVVSMFKLAGTAIGGIAAAVSMAAQGNFSGAKSALGAMSDDIKTEFNEAMNRTTMVQRVEDARAKRLADAAKAKTNPEVKPTLNYTSPKAGSAAANADDPARKERDLALKKIENGLAAERDAMKFHDDYISELRSQDLIDYKTYDAEKRATRDADLASAISAYEKEIAVLQAYKAKTDKLKEKADADLKIEEVRGKKNKAIQDASQKNVMATLEQARAQSELKKVMEDWSRQQSQSLDQMQAEVDMMGLSQVEIAKLIAARRILLDVEEQIRKAKEKGDVSDESIDGYRQQAAAAIKRSIEIYDAGDAKTKDPYFNMTESVRRYGEEAANVGQQIGDAMTNAFHGAEDALVNFAMTGRLSFGDLARSILADLARIQAKNLIASLMGGNGQGALGGGLAGAFMKLGTMAGAGGSSSATGGMGIMGDVIVPSAAGGFDIPAGSNPMTQLHEEEMVLPKQHADVIRSLAGSGGSRGGMTVAPVYNINIEGSTDMAKNQQMIQRATRQANAELVDQLVREGKI